jgi:hypothetical protein
MLELLHNLTIKGLARPEEVADAIGWSPEDVTAGLDMLRSGGLVRYREGRLAGWSVTPEGRSERDRLLRAALDVPAGAALAEGYERFLPLNTRFKELCTHWQARSPGDATVVGGLLRMHPTVDRLLTEMADIVPRFAHYQRRLNVALTRLTAGESEAFTAPRTGSYHDVWMELHADLLATLGRPRSAADEA